jgi:carboxyl-terminal processing protease
MLSCSGATGAVKEAIETLQESGATAFVLDIRNNSGGLFPAGIEIAKMWLDKGVIVYIADSMGIRDIYETDGESALSVKEPLAVLV